MAVLDKQEEEEARYSLHLPRRLFEEVQTLSDASDMTMKDFINAAIEMHIVWKRGIVIPIYGDPKRGNAA